MCSSIYPRTDIEIFYHIKIVYRLKKDLKISYFVYSIMSDWLYGFLLVGFRESTFHLQLAEFRFYAFVEFTLVISYLFPILLNYSLFKFDNLFSVIFEVFPLCMSPVHSFVDYRAPTQSLFAYCFFFYLNFNETTSLSSSSQ